MKFEMLRVTSDADAKRYRSDGHWRDKSIFERFRSAAQQFPEKKAIIDGEKIWLFSELLEAVENLAKNLLDAGISRGNVIGVQLPNCAELPMTHLALNRIGAYFLPLHDSYREHELVHLINKAGASAVICRAMYRGFDYVGMYEGIRSEAPTLEKIIAISAEKGPAVDFEDLLKPSKRPSSDLEALMSKPDEVGTIMLSSGTTSLPKISVFTNNNILCLMDRFADAIQLTDNDVAAALAPMGTGATGYVFPILPPLINGATAVILESWTGPTSAIDLILKHRCTYATAIPTQKTLMVPELEKHSPNEFSFFRCFNNAGAPLPVEVARKLEQLTGCRVASFYGASDGGIPSMGRIDDREDKRHSTVGKILAGTELQLQGPDGKPVPQGEPGEICWRGPDKSFGYLNDLEAARAVFSEENFYKSGDIGEVDADGYLRVVGRVKDMILRGGRNISPRLIEELLIAHPAVVEVAVTAMPHTTLGEQACAFVVLGDGQTLSFEEAIAFLKKAKIPVWQLPERLEVIPEIPKNSGGKMDKKSLMEFITKKLQQEAKTIA